MLDLNDNQISVEDITDRVDELSDERDTFNEIANEGSETDRWSTENADDARELTELEEILAELCDMGGDHERRGDWYPLLLIRDSYFTDYCEELIKDIGDLPQNIPGYLVIDWAATSDNLRADYSTVTIGRREYYYR